MSKKDFNIIKSILPPALLEVIKKDIAEGGWTYGWRSHPTIGFGHWNHDIGGTWSSNGLDITHELPEFYQRAWQHLKTNYFPNHTLVRCYANAHTYGVEGYPHQDSARDYDRTIVIYLNNNWRREWGGETMIYSGNQILHAELPEYNSGLEFKSNLWHCAKPVTRICPELRMTLMFKFAPANSDTDRDDLQRFLKDINAKAFSHRNGDLSKHLMFVYDTLKYSEFDRDTCLAGGAHSVLGTNIYKNVCLPFEERGRLEAVIGPKATELVSLFSIIDRPSELEKSAETGNTELKTSDGRRVKVSGTQLQQLIAIECANLYEQGDLKNFPKLANRWEQIRKKS